MKGERGSGFPSKGVLCIEFAILVRSEQVSADFREHLTVDLNIRPTYEKRVLLTRSSSNRNRSSRVLSIVILPDAFISLMPPALHCQPFVLAPTRG